jgi:hypothetical protein
MMMMMLVLQMHRMRLARDVFADVAVDELAERPL